MTLSIQERTKNLHEALGIMLHGLGDAPLQLGYFNPAEADFARIHNTTWADLVQKSFATKELGGKYYRLTGAGWITAMQVTGRIDDRVFRSQLSALMAYLKGHVEGRIADALVHYHQAATDLHLPAGFIWNVVESRLIESLHGRQGPYWHRSGKTGVIVVPLDFNMPPL